MDEIVKQLKPSPQRPSPGEAAPALRETQDRELRLVVNAQALENMRKQAVVTVESPPGPTYSIVSDEGPYLGGDDSAPPPLAYFSSAIAF